MGRLLWITSAFALLGKARYKRTFMDVSGRYPIWGDFLRVFERWRVLKLDGEYLTRWVFADGREPQAVIEQWRQEYNYHRPHSSLGYLPPAVFADQARLTLDVV